MLRLVVYYSNYSTLGHTATVFLLVKALKECFREKISIVVIETGISRTGFRPFGEYAQSYFFPLPENASNDVFFSGTKNSQKRIINSLKRLFDDLAPDIFITEYYPFCKRPLYAAFPILLDYLKYKFHSKIIGSCTYLNWTNDLDGLIRDYYDAVLVHLPDALKYEYRTYLPEKWAVELDGILKRSQGKMFFTGFLAENRRKLNTCRKAIRSSLDLGRRKLILVSRGGREEFENIIPCSLLLARKHPDWYFLICAGKKCAKTYKLVSKNMKNVRIVEFIRPHFDEYLNASDLSINMAGYNTTVDLLRLSKKTLTMPVSNTEQIWHARLLSRFVPSCIIDRARLEHSILEEKITQLLDRKNTICNEAPRDWFSGAADSVRIIKALSR